MIQFRRNPFSENFSEYEFKEGELVSDLVKRVLESENYTDSDQYQSVFQVVVNGHKLDNDLWIYVKLKESDEVLIAPIISRGSGAQLFKMMAIIAITIVASVYLSPAAGASIGAKLGAATAIAGISIAGTLLMNALIPPPGLPGLGGIGSGPESSQMYSITSQSNNAKRYGTVPKVYGRHRIYPNLAANPYTEVRADPETKELVQYFYCIYDFGLGPCTITDLRIGDTPISSFSDKRMRFVDLNATSYSDEWDAPLNKGTFFKSKTFMYYKGDNESDGTAMALNKNKSSSIPEDEYSFVRNASDKVFGNTQEIILSFVAPEGLIAYGTDGKTSPRTITLYIEFAKVGTEDWHQFTDTNYVLDFEAQNGVAGGIYYTTLSIAPTIDITGSSFGQAVKLSSRKVQLVNYNVFGGPSYGPSEEIIDTWGFPTGRNYIEALTGQSKVGDIISYDGIVWGTVVSVTGSTYSGYQRYNLSRGLPAPIEVYTVSSVRGMLTYNETVFVSKYDAGGKGVITAEKTDQVYATFSFKPIEIAQYKVRVTRLSSESTRVYQIRDKLTLISLNTRFNRDPIKTKNRHLFLEIEIKATNQLNGAIQNLSGICTSVLDTWDGTKWVKKPTSNPAWIFCDLLTGPINKKAISKDRLHLPSIVEWANFCDQVPTPPPGRTFTFPRYQANFVLDYETTLQGVINTLTNACQASLNIVDGKYGVLVDKLKTVPVQVFTPRNSWGFSSSRSYSDTPHALKVRYIDAANLWEAAEIIVYDDGYNAQTATTFEDISTFACTNFDQAFRFGRYMIAQAKLRRETISISVDFEHIVCTRGDFVKVSQDVMKAGGVPARVKSVSGNTVVIDDSLESISGADYGYVYRSSTDGIVTSTLTVINSDTFDLQGSIPRVGDLIIIGEVGKVVMDCIVKNITPDNTMSATLTLVEKADAIYLAESSGTLPTYSPNLSRTNDLELMTPGPVENLEVVANTYRFTARYYDHYIALDWDAPSNSAYDIFEIYVDSGRGYNFWDSTQESFYEYDVNERNLGVLHKFKVLAVSANGKKIDLIEAPEVSATPDRKTARPSDVEALYINITNEVISLEWPAILDSDLKEYFIRFSPRLDKASWEASTPLLRAARDTNLASTQGRVGTYLIKAVDYNGNESLNAAVAITSIPNLFDLNIIGVTNDFPALTGAMYQAAKEGDTLVIRNKVSGGVSSNEYYSEAFYYYNDFLDLGEIYTVRIQSLVEAEGFTVGDMMINWVTLNDVTWLTNARQSDWDVESQYRATNTFNTMANWTQLALVDPLNEGQDDQWTPWRKFTIGDATGRLFQFRLRLVSNLASVTPRVFSGIIKSDMPDRIHSGENMICPVGGMRIIYDPPFKGPLPSPNVQVTQDDAEFGDYFKISDKDLEGFYIEFFDVNDNSVSRQFDYSSKGYGRRTLTVI